MTRECQITKDISREGTIDYISRRYSGEILVPVLKMGFYHSSLNKSSHMGLIKPSYSSLITTMVILSLKSRQYSQTIHN